MAGTMNLQQCSNVGVLKPSREVREEVKGVREMVSKHVYKP